MSTTIDDRLWLILLQQAPAEGSLLEAMARGLNDLAADGHYVAHGFWKRLGESTGVPSPRWRNFFSGNQNATPAMIEAAAKQWPEFAFWLATGITDAVNGHVAPKAVLPFPERLQHESIWPSLYFRKEIELNGTLSDRARIDCTDPTARRSAALRMRTALGSPADRNIISVVYQLCKTDAYDELQMTWKAREQNRANTLAHVTGVVKPEPTPEGEVNLGQLDPFSFLDSRVSHQGKWDLFYKPRPAQKKAKDPMRKVK